MHVSALQKRRIITVNHFFFPLLFLPPHLINIMKLQWEQLLSVSPWFANYSNNFCFLSAGSAELIEGMTPLSSTAKLIP